MVSPAGLSYTSGAVGGTTLVSIIDEQKDHCICNGCPTYNECMREKGELLYCIAGRSPTCAFEKKGCVCPMCPVRVKLGLTKAYYCVRGSENEQKGIPEP